MGVKEWWGEKRTEREVPESDGAAWERMLELDTSQINDPETKEIIEIAYLRSHRHYEQKQAEDKIWDTVMQGVSVEDLREEMKKFKSNN